MSKLFFFNNMTYGLLGLAFILLTNACESVADEKQNLKNKLSEQVNNAIAPDAKSTIDDKTHFFSPSHEDVLELIKREDGDFDTPFEIKYQAPDGKVWKAPAGTITDGASIPSHFTSLFGGKMNKKHLFAAIVHDAYCGEANQGKASYQVESWKDTHHMFYHACLKNGTDKTRASTMYAAVRLGGPRWSLNGEPVVDLSKVEKSKLMKAMQECITWIASKSGTVTLQEIDSWMEDMEMELIKNL